MKLASASWTLNLEIQPNNPIFVCFLTLSGRFQSGLKVGSHGDMVGLRAKNQGEKAGLRGKNEQ